MSNVARFTSLEVVWCLAARLNRGDHNKVLSVGAGWRLPLDTDPLRDMLLVPHSISEIEDEEKPETNTLAPAEPENLTTMRIAAKTLLHLERQAGHAANHVRYSARDPYLHPGRKGDDDAPRIGNRRARMVESSEAGIVRRRPFGRPISIVLSSSDRSGAVIS